MIEADEPRSRRDRPAKPPLSRAVITSAALELVECDGLGAVSLRKVAERLDTGPASLYAYVSNREELLERMLDRVLSEVPLAAVDPPRWRALVVDLFTGVLHVLSRYPGLAQVAFGSILGWPGALAICERTLALFRCGEADPQGAAWATDALFLFTIGTAVENTMHADPLGVVNNADRFVFAVNAIIDGARHP